MGILTHLVAFGAGLYFGVKGFVYIYNWNVRHEKKEQENSMTPRQSGFRKKLDEAMEEAKKK